MKEITIEDVLKKYIYKNIEGFGDGLTVAGAEAAMTEYASLNRQGWTRVEDGLPEDGQRVVVIQNPKTTATRKSLYAEYDAERKKFRNVGYSHDGIHLGLAYWSDIILWMPLPEYDESMPLPNKPSI